MKVKFVKTESAGNDFILFDFISEDSCGLQWKSYVPKLCSRRRGIGADGVLVLEKEAGADFKMRIFNPDGSEVDMCGNGARCSAAYYFMKTGRNEVDFITGAGAMRAERGDDSMIRLFMPEPRDIKINMEIKLNGKNLKGAYINTGVPHFVAYLNDISGMSVKEAGRSIRYNESFAPEGTNADFISIKNESEIAVRTYERGVEDETPACGTGVTACAVVAVLKDKLSLPLNIETRGGGMMRVDFDFSPQEGLISHVDNVRLEGEAAEVFRGEVALENFAEVKC
ncbi:MAG: diaminopimelate epimerase [Elusimicrobiota bacterium]